MALWLPLQIITDNIGMQFGYLVPLVLFIAGLTFFAINFKLGVVLSFLTNFGVFMWFYNANIYYVPSLVLGFIMLVLMAFSLLAVHERDLSGGRFI